MLRKMASAIERSTGRCSPNKSITGACGWFYTRFLCLHSSKNSKNQDADAPTITAHRYYVRCIIK